MADLKYKDNEIATVFYGLYQTPFAEAFVVLSNQGIHCVHFLQQEDDFKFFKQQSQQQWPSACFRQDDSKIKSKMDEAFFGDSSLVGLALKGTAFQLKVWHALRSIPKGQLVCYQDMAQKIGQSTATRAVASAVAKNPIAYLVPCHRVIAKSGSFHYYRWGDALKKQIIQYEQAENTKKFA
jgi:AraC family transcriptional regulator, regulatory protein of adaptative response / methylated-DNA-[protein]-cysteine methyltransferase